MHRTTLLLPSVGSSVARCCPLKTLRSRADAFISYLPDLSSFEYVFKEDSDSMSINCIILNHGG